MDYKKLCRITDSEDEEKKNPQPEETNENDTPNEETNTEEPYTETPVSTEEQAESTEQVEQENTEANTPEDNPEVTNPDQENFDIPEGSNDGNVPVEEEAYNVNTPEPEIDTPAESNNIHSNQPESDPSQTQPDQSQQPIIVINAQPQSNDINSNATNEAIMNNGNLTSFVSETTSNPQEILQELDAFLDMDVKKSFIDYIGRMKNITLTTVNDSKINDGLVQSPMYKFIHACANVFGDELVSHGLNSSSKTSDILNVLKASHSTAFDLFKSYCDYTGQDAEKIAKYIIWAKASEDVSKTSDSKISDTSRDEGYALAHASWALEDSLRELAKASKLIKPYIEDADINNLNDSLIEAQKVVSATHKIFEDFVDNVTVTDSKIQDATGSEYLDVLCTSARKALNAVQNVQEVMLKVSREIPRAQSLIYSIEPAFKEVQNLVSKTEELRDDYNENIGDSKISDDEDCDLQPGDIVSVDSRRYGKYKGKVVKVEPTAGIGGKVLIRPINTGLGDDRWESIWDLDDDISDCDASIKDCDKPNINYGKKPSGHKYPNIDKYLREKESKKYDPMEDSKVEDCGTTSADIPVTGNGKLYETVDATAGNGSINDVINESSQIAKDFSVEFDDKEGGAFVSDYFDNLDSLKDYLEEEYGIYGLKIDNYGDVYVLRLH